VVKGEIQFPGHWIYKMNVDAWTIAIILLHFLLEFQCKLATYLFNQGPMNGQLVNDQRSVLFLFIF